LRRVLTPEDHRDGGALVLLASCGPEPPQTDVAQLVVGDDVLRDDPGRGEQEEGDETCAVAAAATLHDGSTRIRVGDGGHGGGAPLRLPVEKRPVVEGAAVELVGPAGPPELLVARVVQARSRTLKHPSHSRCRSGAGLRLAIFAAGEE
jgi:hypothetical protein